ncbi:MAG: terminase family protein [Nanoarchaeota archaeon]|nr:terminase family protein [Nanoarchaeota archaeon]
MKGLIRFQLYDFQEQIIKDLQDNRFGVVLKARQLGVSTIIAGYCTWLVLFHRSKNILVVATKLDTSVGVVRKAKAMYKSIPNWLKISDLVVDNRNSFELGNASIMKGVATSEDVGRSEALSLLVIDEAAHIPGLEDLWTGLYSTLSTGGKCVMASTPNGAQGHFYKTYVESETKENDFHASIYPWDVHPERDQAWFDKETKNMTRRQIAQELLCNFNMSGETVFSPEDVERIEKIEVSEPIYRTAFDRNLWIWEEFIPGNTYSLVADVSRGDSHDFSVAHVFKIGKVNELVAEYCGKATPDVFSNFLFNLGRQYGECLLIVENNSVGFAVLDKLIETKYPNIYYSEKSTHDFIESYQAENRSGVVAGFTTTQKTRPLIVAKMEEMLRNKQIIVHSKRLLNEMKTFVWNGARAEAQRGYNDDLVMACAIGCFVRDLVFTVNTLDMEYKKAFLDCIFRSQTVLNSKISGQIGAPKNVEFEEQEQRMKEYDWIYTDARKPTRR